MVQRSTANQLTPFFDRSKTVPFFYRSISVLFPFRCTYRTTVLTVPFYGRVNVNLFLAPTALYYFMSFDFFKIVGKDENVIVGKEEIVDNPCLKKCEDIIAVIVQQQTILIEQQKEPQTAVK